ncbi:MAG: hypothetical protein QW770_00105 [Candidatus Bathyarchaeia archaeon]
MALKSVKRKMLAAREDLVERISDIARRRGTLYDFVNEVLNEAIRADSMGITLREALNEYGLVKMAKDSGFTLVPERLWYDVIEKVGSRSGWARKLWYEAGEWYAKFYGSPEKFADSIKKLFWDVVEFNVSKLEDEGLIVRCLCPKFTVPVAELFSSFLEGAYGVFGFHPVKRETSRGVVYMEFTLRGEG